MFQFPRFAAHVCVKAFHHRHNRDDSRSKSPLYFGEGFIGGGGGGGGEWGGGQPDGSDWYLWAFVALFLFTCININAHNYLSVCFYTIRNSSFSRDIKGKKPGVGVPRGFENNSQCPWKYIELIVLSQR